MNKLSRKNDLFLYIPLDKGTGKDFHKNIELVLDEKSRGKIVPESIICVFQSIGSQL